MFYNYLHGKYEIYCKNKANIDMLTVIQARI